MEREKECEWAWLLAEELGDQHHMEGFSFMCDESNDRVRVGLYSFVTLLIKITQFKLKASHL